MLPREGKSFTLSPSTLQKIEKLPGVEVLSEVIEDNVLLRYQDGQMVVTLKGVSDNYVQQTGLDSSIIFGKFELKDKNQAYAIIGRGVRIRLSVSIRDPSAPLQVWYPRRSQKVNLSNLSPEKNFNRQTIRTGGVFSLEQNYDNKYVFVPIAFAQKLLEYGPERTSLEIKIKSTASIERTKQSIKEILGSAYTVKNSEEQEASLLKAIQIEKFFVYLTLSFILAVASFNIFFSLMMLVIDKKKDIAILRAMGAPRNLIRQIFFSEGIIIAFGGALTGLFLGLAICLLQQKYGLVSMGTTNTIVSAYPVKLKWIDFAYTSLTIIVITVLSSYIPAINATRVDVKENL